MSPAQETDLTEVVEILITIRAQQAAILKLLRWNQVPVAKIEEALREADQRIGKLPVVQEVLSKKRLPPPQSLARTLAGFPWDV
jgi:hypothetical protein